ncbi:MAG: hypothetical protein IJR93_00685 [Treponema sp.]|nr:hypothetical protein [Treponema sp.]
MVKRLFYFILFTALFVFSLYSSVRDIGLLFRHTEVSATVIGSRFTSGKVRYEVVTYEYEMEGQTFLKSSDLFAFFPVRHSVGSQLAVLVGDDGYTHIKSAVLPEIVFFIFAMAFSLFGVIASAFGNFPAPVVPGSAVVFYVQESGRRRKLFEVRRVRVGEWFGKLERGEILCCGFSSGNDFREFSFSGGKYYLRVSQNGSETETEFANRSQAEQRIEREWRTAFLRA